MQERDEDSIDPVAIAAFLRRNALIVCGTTLAVIALTVAVLTLLPQRYSAHVLILVEGDNPALAETAPRAPVDAARIASEAEILRSEPVLRAAAATLYPAADAATRASQVETLREATLAVRRNQTYLIDLDASASDPTEAARIANTVAAAYLAEQVRGRIERIAAVQAALAAEIAEAERENAGSDTGAATRIATLRARAAELDTAIALQLPDSRIVGAASPPLAPEGPPWRLVAVLSTLAGLAAGIGLALLRETFRGTITGHDHVARLFPGDTVVPLPHRHPLATGERAADVIITDPDAPFSLAIRRLRAIVETELGAAESERAGKSVWVMGDPAPGGDTVALALARSYALAGLETLLVGSVDGVGADVSGAISHLATREEAKGLHLFAPSRSADGRACPPSALAQVLASARSRYARVLVVCGPAPDDAGPDPAETGAAVLVLDAARTSIPHARAARQAIDRVHKGRRTIIVVAADL